MKGGTEDHRALTAGIEKRHLRLTADIALQFAQVAAEIKLGLDSLPMPIQHPVSGRAELRAKIARGPNLTTPDTDHLRRVMRKVAAIEAAEVADTTAPDFLRRVGTQV